jgi:hypothetical protein
MLREPQARSSLSNKNDTRDHVVSKPQYDLTVTVTGSGCLRFEVVIPRRIRTKSKSQTGALFDGGLT